MPPRKVPLSDPLSTATKYPTLNGLGLPRQLTSSVNQSFQMIYGLRDMLGDVLNKPGLVTFGLADDTVGTNTPGHYGNIEIPGQPAHAAISCVTPPTTADAIFDMLVSHDNGTTWTSIFIKGNPYRYPAHAAGLVQFTGIFATTAFAIGDMLRVDTLQAGGAAGITGTVRWA